MFIKKICCETGNRPEKLPHIKFGDFGDINFMEYIEGMYYRVGELIRADYNYFVCGVARGVDLDFAEAIINFREGNLGEGCEIMLEVALPCKNQTRGWKKEEIERYNKILEKADIVNYISLDYTFDCMQKRNEYMVDKADLVIAFWNGEEKGGTFNTINYAKSQNKTVDLVNLENK